MDSDQIGRASLGPGAREGAAAAPIWLQALVLAALIGGLHLASRYDYLLFHSLAEAFSVVIACGIFMIGWNARAFMASSYLLFLGIAYLVVGGLDFVHLLAFRGMGAFHRGGADLAAQLWVSARGVEALSLLLAPFFVKRALRPGLALGVYVLGGATLLAAIFNGYFPTCYRNGVGLTGFKISSEVAICLLLAAAALLMTRQRDHFGRDTYRMILTSILCTVASEAAFTLYEEPYGLLNQLGHVLKILSFYLIYQATIANALRKPYSLLFLELKQSEEALRRSNRELEGYAHTVSHDLKNPLAAVIGAGQAMQKLAQQSPTEVGDLQKMAGIAVRSGRKAVELVNDLLNLAEAGQRPRRVEAVRVSEVVTRILEERAGSLGEAGVAVVVDHDLGVIRAAPAHVYQIFGNLIANALRHNRSERPTLEVRRLNGPAIEGCHRFQVRDNGAGIPESDLPHLFQPFFKGRDGGHGIGLSTVQKIVALYGGEIRAFNESGACFELSLRDWPDHRE